MLPILYAFDIETDTSLPGSGLDPRITRITSVAVKSEHDAFVLDDTNESRMLASLDQWMTTRETQSGVVVTWNGANFDMPFMADRAKIIGSKLQYSVKLLASEDRAPKYNFLPGHTSGYKARLGQHRHADICFAYKQWAAEQGISCSLKAVAKAKGIKVIEVDRTQMELLSSAERLAYNFSDVVATLELAKLLGDEIYKYIDYVD